MNENSFEIIKSFCRLEGLVFTSTIENVSEYSLLKIFSKGKHISIQAVKGTYGYRYVNKLGDKYLSYSKLTNKPVEDVVWPSMVGIRLKLDLENIYEVKPVEKQITKIITVYEVV